MADLVEIRAVVRPELLQRVVHALKDAGVPRLTVTRVHAVGAGVDPARAKLSLEEGSEYVDKALVQFICEARREQALTAVVLDAARTGRRGDGIVSVHPVTAVTKIRTRLAGIAALS